MPDERALSWLLAWYRQSELEGALLLGRMVRVAADPVVGIEHTRHCADEARHAWLWQRAIGALDLKPVRIFRSYQSFYTGERALPQGLPDVLALTHVFEHRVDREFGEQVADAGLAAPVRSTFRALLRDEKRHLDWIGRWLRQHPDGARLVAHYRTIDERVAAQLRPFRHCLWDVPGLGEEMVEVCDGAQRTC